VFVGFVGDVVVDGADEVGLHVLGLEHRGGWFGFGVCGWFDGGVFERDVVCAVG
jgi:hypothetical protein